MLSFILVVVMFYMIFITIFKDVNAAVTTILIFCGLALLGSVGYSIQSFEQQFNESDIKVSILILIINSFAYLIKCLVFIDNKQRLRENKLFDNTSRERQIKKYLVKMHITGVVAIILGAFAVYFDYNIDKYDYIVLRFIFNFIPCICFALLCIKGIKSLENSIEKV